MAARPFAGCEVNVLFPDRPGDNAINQRLPGFAAATGIKTNIPIVPRQYTLGEQVRDVVTGGAVLTIGASGEACILAAAFHPGPEVATLTSAHAAPDRFLPIGVVMNAAGSPDWTAGLSGCAAVPAAEAGAFAASGRIAEAPPLLPCLTGIRMPLNRPDAKGRIDGLHPGVTRAMLGSATMEGSALQFAACVAARRRVGTRPERSTATGGGTRCDLWLRLTATALDQPPAQILRPTVTGRRAAARQGTVAAGVPMDSPSTPIAPQAAIGPDPASASVFSARRARIDALMPVPGTA